MDIDASQSHPITYQALDFLDKQVVLAVLEHEEAAAALEEAARHESRCRDAVRRLEGASAVLRKDLSFNHLVASADAGETYDGPANPAAKAHTNLWATKKKLPYTPPTITPADDDPIGAAKGMNALVTERDRAHALRLSRRLDGGDASRTGEI